MPKEKKKLIDESNERVTLFYYEIIGVVTLLFSIVALGKLGKAGNILSTIFKILFGDWSFLFIIYLLFMGLFYLFVHEPFNYKGHRFIGFIFLSIVIILFSHFSIHSYVNKLMLEEQESYLSITFKIYKNYLNSGQSNNLGGGIVGGVLFYLINSLIGNIGVVLIGIFLSILSLSLIFKTPFFDIFKWGFSRLKGTGSFIKSFNNFFKYEIGKDIGKNELKIPLYTFDDSIIYVESLIDKNTEYILKCKEKIIEILNSNKIKFIKTEYIISNYITFFNIYTYGIYDESYIIDSFEELDLDKQVYLNKDILVIELKTKYKYDLSIKELLTKENIKNKDILPLGKSVQNEFININFSDYNNILVIGNNYDNNLFINFFLTELYVLNKSSEYDIYMYNSFKEYTIYDQFINVYESIFSFISHIKDYIDERINIINKYNCLNYNEYINKYSHYSSNKDFLKKSFIIINSIVEEFDDLKELESELIYLTQYSKKCGISFIYSVTNPNYINNVINSIFDVKILYRCDNDLIMKVANADEPSYKSVNLLGLGDSYISINHKFLRTCTPILKEEEINKINELISKKINNKI